MINRFSDEEINAQPEPRDPFDDPDKRVVMTRDDVDAAQIAYALSFDDEVALGGLDDDYAIDNDIYQAADEELSIVDATDIGIGYGLDEEELAQLTGRPN